MLARLVFAVAIAASAVQGTGAEEGKTTCEFTADIGTGKLQCKVPEVKKKCCALQKGIDKCMKDKDGSDTSCYVKVFKDNGFDEKKIAADSTYVDKECPVLSALKSEDLSKKYCTVEKGADIKEDKSLLEKSTCSLADGPKACDIPGVKKICCKLANAANAIVACQQKDADEVSCQTAAFTKLMPDLLAAGVDIQAAEDVTYWDGFCPVMSKPPSAEDEKKYCHGGDTKLFSINMKRGFSFVKQYPVSNEGSVAPIVAMVALGVAFVVVLFAIATKRLAPAHSADEVELEPVTGEESLIA